VSSASTADTPGRGSSGTSSCSPPTLLATDPQDTVDRYGCSLQQLIDPAVRGRPPSRSWTVPVSDWVRATTALDR
jgi:hypothetical protein